MNHITELTRALLRLKNASLDEKNGEIDLDKVGQFASEVVEKITEIADMEPTSLVDVILECAAEVEEMDEFDEDDESPEDDIIDEEYDDDDSKPLPEE